jgi:hypothetical protein
MLVNVPRLVTACYTEAPDPEVPAQRVAFGTSGHRGTAFNRSFNEGHSACIADLGDGVEMEAMGSAPVRQEMKRVRQLAGASGGYVCSAAVPAGRPSADYMARVIPQCDGVAIPLEDA